MSKVRYTMRFYRAHDLDLITFIETHEFNIMHAVYSALNAFVSGEVFVIEIPPRRQSTVEYQRVYNRALFLDSERDKEAVELLSSVSPGYRNSFLKNLLRLYLCCPFSEEYFISGDGAEKAMEMTSVFRTDRRVAQAGTIRKKEKRKERKKAGTEFPAESEKENKKENKKIPEKETEEKTESGNSVPEKHKAVTIPDSYFSSLEQNDKPEEKEKNDENTGEEDINDIFNGIMGTMEER